MIRLIAIAAFALAVATSAEAMTPAPIHQPEGVITQVALRLRLRVGHELEVSAWPEPPSAMPAGLSAGVPDGTEAFALGTTERPTLRLTRQLTTAAAPSAAWRSFAAMRRALSRVSRLVAERRCGSLSK